MQTCLQEETGSSGVTCAGNFTYVMDSHPAWLFIENVPRLASTPNMVFSLKELQRAGYQVTWSLRVASDYMLSQSRKRLWLHAGLASPCHPGWEVELQEIMDEMMQPHPVPLHKFALSSTSAHRQYVLRETQSSKAKTNKSCRQRWKADHWVARCRSKLETQSVMPEDLRHTAKHSSFVDREMDFLVMMRQQGAIISELAKLKPILEL